MGTVKMSEANKECKRALIISYCGETFYPQPKRDGTMHYNMLNDWIKYPERFKPPTYVRDECGELAEVCVPDKIYNDQTKPSASKQWSDKNPNRRRGSRRRGLTVSLKEYEVAKKLAKQLGLMEIGSSNNAVCRNVPH